MRRFVSLLVLLALLTACAAPFSPPGGPTPLPGGQSGEADGDKVTISYAAWEVERELYETLAQKFTADNPNIQVVIVPLDDLMNMVSSDEPQSPLDSLRHVVSGADTAPSFLATSEAYGTNLLLNLRPLLEADASFNRDDFLPGSLERVTVNDGIWALPRYFYAPILNYNKSLFAQSNLPEPQAGWSWDDLLGTAEQLARKNGSSVETYGFFDVSGGILPLLGDLRSKDIDLLSTPADEVRIDLPEVVAAIERVRGLTESGALFHGYLGRPIDSAQVDDPAEDPTQLVRDGRVAIWSSDMLPNVIYNDDGTTSPLELPFEVGKVPYPPAGGLFASGASEGYIISGGTAHPNESWKWIEFLSRQQTDPPSTDGGYTSPGRVPARQSLAAETGFWESLDEETSAAYRWVIANPSEQPSSNFDYNVMSALSEAVSAALSDPKADIEKTLQEAQQRYDEQRAEAALTPTPEPDNSPVIVATPEPQAAPEGATTLRFGMPYTMQELRRLARTFRQDNPDIFVELVSTDTLTQAAELPQMAQMSDCFIWWGAPQQDTEFAGLLDLKPLFDADASFPRDDYPQTLLTPFERNGGLYGLPIDYSVRTLNFNRTAFDAAGIATPTYQWSTDDFLAAAQSLTKGEGDDKQYGYVSISGAVQDILFFAGQFGAQLTTGSGKDVRPNYDDPGVVRAIQWYIDLANTHQVMPELQLSYRADDTGEGMMDVFQIVQQGRAGMWFDWGYGAITPPEIGGDGGGKPFGQAPDFEVGLAPLPVGGGGLGLGDFSVRGMYISASSSQAQACWEWLKFVSADVTMFQGNIPARTSVAESDAFISSASPGTAEMASIYADALKQPARAGTDSNSIYSRIDTYWLLKAIDQAAKDEVPLDQGLVEAQRLTQAFLDCLEARGETKTATCAKQVDPEYQGYNTQDIDVQPVEGIPLPRPRG